MTTAHDLRIAQQIYIDTCESFGLIPAGFHLVFSTGSKTYGNAYRVALTGDAVPYPGGVDFPNGSGHGHPPIGSDFLGLTKADAERALRERCAAVLDFAHALKIESK